jgi:hydroxyacylglutathione hydrolase
MYFKQIFDKKLAQYSYLIGCQETGEAIIIDPLRDVDQYHELAKSEDLNITAAADTHIHADFVSGLREFAAEGIKVFASNEGGEDWTYEWLADDDYKYQLLRDGDRFSIGNIDFEVCHTPGHTPESISHFVTDSAAADTPMGILTGDFVFVGDVGRPDLLETAAGEKGAMKPAAKVLYHSVSQFKSLPNYLQVWPGHGAGSACGKAMGAVPMSTVGYEIQYSPAFKASQSENQFVAYVLDAQPEPPLYFGRMKKINKSGAPILKNLPDPPKLSIEQVLEIDGTIIDTRERSRFMKRHLPETLLVSFDDNFNTVAGSYINYEDDIYLITKEEKLEQAVRDLIRVGLDNIQGYVPQEELDRWNGRIEQIEAINFDDVENQLNEPDVQVVDVRSASEYNEEHIPGAEHFVYKRLPDHLDELPKDKTLLVHCGSGQRASYASSLLEREGFTVKWVDEYFTEWQKSYSSADKE